MAETNGVSPEFEVSYATSHVTFCQPSEFVPRGTTSVVAWIGSFIGPAVSVEISVGNREIAHGRRGPGWTSRSVTIPLSRAVAHGTNATVCFRSTPKHEEVTARGNVRKGRPAMTVNGKPLKGAIAIEYLHRGPHSWLSRAPEIARRLGLGRVPSGAWAPVLAIMLVFAIGAAVAVAGRLE
ncbi:MAG TPA: hypothetical protein VN817_07625 [Solirubrobacteraceae bacterium]|nr:hypothetical protein [Solirubrobacteraceae bacterium]